MNLTTLLTLSDFEQAACATLDQSVWAYVAGGAGSANTINANSAAFDAVWLRSRVSEARCTKPATSVTLLGHDMPIPVLLAPTSPQRLLHPDAELATARAAGATGVVSIVSTDTHYPFPMIAEMSRSACWFQLYAYGSRANIEATLDLALESGASGIVITMDAHYPARRITAQRAGFKTPPYVDFGTLRTLGILKGDVPAEARLERVPLTWADLSWIRDRVTVPLMIKGLLRASDARRAIDLGADGIIVSNHGGRQLDGAMPSLVALEQIAREVRHNGIVLVDSGVRSGVDVIKGLALGAHAVCIGRPYLWGLSIGGEAGVEAVITLLQREIEDTLLQLGLSDICEIGPDCVADLRWLPRNAAGYSGEGASGAP
jgi:4-hydroxymandelate oxidase